MTLCIAAACREANDLAFVLCSDHKIGTSVAQAEIGFKFSWVFRNWPAVVAGDLSRTEELVATFQTSLGDTQLDHLNAFDCMKAAANSFRDKLVEEIVRKKLSVSYDYLRRNRSKFPPATVYEVYTAIAQVDSEAELIAVGFLGDRTFIFVVNRDCTVSYRHHFAAIGTGAHVAEPALFQREQNRMNSLSDTLYKVFEAKKLGEIADAVGERTSIVVISLPRPQGETVVTRWVTDEGYKFLKDKYERFGLRPISGMAIEPHFLRSAHN